MNNFWTSLPRPILALAPMEGVTDFAFRQICKDWGADLIYCEFVAADAINYGAKPVLDKLKFDKSQRPIIAQIFGKNIETFRVAAKTIEKMGFDGLDINLGCPARKVVHSGSGAALLRDPAHARLLIEAALESCDLPISLKIRTSIKKTRGSTEIVTVLDFLKAVKDLPIAAVMVHGRAFELGHSGAVDLDMIKRVKETFPGVVLANGGINTPADAQRTLKATGADGLGIARGAWGAPWIFKQVKDYLNNGAITIIPWADRRVTIIKQASLMFEDKGPHGLLELRKHLTKYISGLPHAAALRRQAVTVTTVAEVESLVREING